MERPRRLWPESRTAVRRYSDLSMQRSPAPSGGVAVVSDHWMARRVSASVSRRIMRPRRSSTVPRSCCAHALMDRGAGSARHLGEHLLGERDLAVAAATRPSELDEPAQDPFLDRLVEGPLARSFCWRNSSAKNAIVALVHRWVRPGGIAGSPCSCPRHARGLDRLGHCRTAGSSASRRHLAGTVRVATQKPSCRRKWLTTQIKSPPRRHRPSADGTDSERTAQQ